MATSSWSSTYGMSNDTEFRNWMTEFSNNLAVIGLVKTSDTGQINISTAVRPAAGTAAGYEIWRFNDSLQATAPIFLKIEYGTAPAGFGYLGIWITVGTGSNGSGTINGIVGTRTSLSVRNVPPASTSVPSYFSHSEGFLGIVFKHAAVSNHLAEGAFCIVRTCDNTGTPTATGFAVFYPPGLIETKIQVFNLISSTVSAIVNATSCIVPQSITTSTLGSDQQVFLHWVAVPRMQPLAFIGTVINSEFPISTTLSVALVGSTARTFITVGSVLGYPCPSGGATYGIVFLWE